MSFSIDNGDQPWNYWAEEVIMWQEQEELNRSVEVNPVIDERIATEVETSIAKENADPLTLGPFSLSRHYLQEPRASHQSRLQDPVSWPA